MKLLKSIWKFDKELMKALYLLENGISIFVVSTFNTDYILIKQGNVEKTKEVLSNNGYEVI